MHPSGSSEIPASIENVVRSQVENVVTAKFNEYKRIAWAFLLGFGCLFTFLIANRLISENSLLVYVHDQLFGTERGIDAAVNLSVALSYSNQFVLNRTTPVQYLTFYANDLQTVVALVDVKHHGKDTPSKVIVRFDRMADPIWSGTDEMDFSKLDLTPDIRKPAEFSPGEHLHNLTFELDPAAPRNTDDEIHIRILINVIGLEQKPK
jgi:hypothetical protein